MNDFQKRIARLEERNQPAPPPVEFAFEVEPAKGPIRVTLPGGKTRIIEPEATQRKAALEACHQTTGPAQPKQQK
jgi:hypothetical protein